MILNSPTISGSLTVTGNIIASGSITLSGSVTSASYAASASNALAAQTASYVLTAQTASFVALAQSASNAVSAVTASFANAFTVAGTLTAQTLVVQTITSSVDFVTGSTRFGSLLDNTHVFTGSVNITGSLAVVTTGTEFQVTSTGVRIGNVSTDTHPITGSVNVSGSLSGSSAAFNSNVSTTTGTTGATIKLGGFTNYGTIQDANDVRRIWFENVGSYRTIFDLPPSGSAFAFRTYDGTSLFNIATTGASTFSGSVTMGGNTLTSTGPTGFTLKTTTTGAWTALYGDTGGLYLGTNAGNWMTIVNSGYIGVGTPSPKNIFQITNLTSSGVLPAVGAIGIGTSLYLTNNNTGYGMLMGMLPTGDGWIQVQRTDANATVYNLQLQPNGGDINMSTSSGNRTVYLKGQTGNGYYGELRMGNADHSAGIIGKHVSSGNANLELCTEYYSSGGYRAVMTVFYTGNASLTGALTQNTSDKRLKDNVKNIDNALNKVMALNGVTFDWNDIAVEYGWSPRIKNNDIGVIAQEVQAVLPQAIAFAPFDRNDKDESKSGEDYLTVQYEKIVPLLIESIKELKSQNDALQSRIETLESK